MGFRFEWSREKTVMRYLAEGADWNWKDYHVCVRTSLFSLQGGEALVDTLIDFRGSTRTQMPAGMLAHVRTFGKKYHPRISGRAVAIGFPKDAEQALDLSPDRTLATPDGWIQFVDNDTEAREAILRWRNLA